MEKYKMGWGNVKLPKDHYDITREKNYYLTIGNSRSYGDVCELAGGVVNSCAGKNRFISWDENNSIIELEAGVTIGELCQFALSKKMFPTTVPGTQFPTIGGCIANDVHGKNHHQNGSFGCGVNEITLRRNGEIIKCSANENAEIFYATIGGLGLTGEILSAKLKLIPMPSPYLSVTQHKFETLAEYLELDKKLKETSAYTVAWVDCSKISAPSVDGYRGIYMAGTPAEVDEKQLAKHYQLIRAKNFTFPLSQPFSLVGKLSLRAFNSLYYNFPRPDSNTAKITHYQPFFFPLDKMLLWNRVYGKKGFYQYQSVIPFDNAIPALSQMLSLISASGNGSPLMVLKNLGDIKSGGLLSFPRAGITLALDFVNKGQETLDLLDKLDEITINAGGCGNPSKDARMSAATFAKYFPNANELEKLREKNRCSDFWLRVNQGKL